MIQIASKEKQLKNLEDIIQHSKSRAETHWFEVGKALCKIRDGELHPQRTFEQYCLQRWGFKRSHANSLCRSFEALKDREMSGVPPTLTGTVPTSELSARAGEALASVPEEQREAVLEDAKKSGSVTGKSIKKAAAKKAPKTERPKDKNGYPIPERAIAIWNRRNELNDKLRPLYELKQWAIDMQGTDDIFFRHRGFNFGKLALETEALIFHLKQTTPEVVCTKCHGVDPACDFCYGRGMISTALAHGTTPIEMKEMRDKLTSNDSTEKLSSASR